MTTARYETVLEQAQRLPPAEQERLMAALEELADMRAYDAAVAAQAGEELIPLDQAIAEIEAEWAARQSS
jgi:hypothetical protein